MSKPVVTRTVPCTFSDCKLTFPTVEEMIQHKKNDNDHEYCPRCDEDFENEESMLIHKLLSQKHIACGKCGMEFRSEAGRDIHVRRNHPHQQDIECLCGQTFGRAMAIIAHIERGDCNILNQIDLVRGRAFKMAIQNSLTVGDGLRIRADLHKDASLPSVSGGVPVNHIKKDQKTIVNEFKGKQKAHVGKPPDVGSFDLNQNQWPRLGEERQSLENAQSKEKKRPPPLDFAHQSNFETFHSKLSLEPKLGAAGDKGSKAGGMGQHNTPPKPGSFGQKFPNRDQTIRVFVPGWDPDAYKDGGEYKCKCGASYEELKPFEEHIIHKLLYKGTLCNCPACPRDFNSLAALMAHIEAMPRRCPFKGLDNFASLVDQLSGGVVSFAGYHPDGTGKFVAGSIEAPDRDEEPFVCDDPWENPQALTGLSKYERQAM